ncbi:hypothetical protein [Tateyamaria sp. SN3-11]|uniref:hypothetical protein n=1 Tax=Tateyamaria sp. SN3-11 TaxID=3092147 RepID=UPI0039ED5DF4
MKPLATTKILLMTSVFAIFPYRLETDFAGKLTLVASLAHAESGSGSDGDGGDDGEGGDDGGGGEGGDDGGGGEGGDDGSDGDGDDGDSGDDGDDGESGDDGDDGESGDDGDDGESGDDGDDGEGERKASRAVKAQKLGNGARIFYSDGSREEIQNGQYVRSDRNGRVLERRRAQSSDLARVRALVGGQGAKVETAPSGVKSRAVKAIYRGNNVQILYANGWREEISSGRYKLTDQYGRTVTSRRATQIDRNRLNRFRNK